MSEFTRILFAIEQGGPFAAEQRLPPVYNELRKLAGIRLTFAIGPARIARYLARGARIASHIGWRLVTEDWIPNVEHRFRSLRPDSTRRLGVLRPVERTPEHMISLGSRRPRDRMGASGTSELTTVIASKPWLALLSPPKGGPPCRSL